jgi:hypothetical protein
MTKDELEARVAVLEDLLDYSEEINLKETEAELCQIYKMLNKMLKLEVE